MISEGIFDNPSTFPVHVTPNWSFAHEFLRKQLLFQEHAITVAIPVMTTFVLFLLPLRLLRASVFISIRFGK